MRDCRFTRWGLQNRRASRPNRWNSAGYLEQTRGPSWNSALSNAEFLHPGSTIVCQRKRHESRSVPRGCLRFGPTSPVDDHQSQRVAKDDRTPTVEFGNAEIIFEQVGGLQSISFFALSPTVPQNRHHD